MRLVIATVALLIDAAADAPTAAVLDGGFWRQVAAGVLVTVVSTLILRAVL